MLRVKLVELELQIFVCMRFAVSEYNLVERSFHLSKTWVQKGLLSLRLRAKVLCVRKAIGVGVSWFKRIFAQSSFEV